MKNPKRKTTNSKMGFYIIFGVIAVGVFFYFAFAKNADSVQEVKHGSAASSNTAYLDIPFNDIQGKAAKLADYKGKVMLLVNVASECGYTPQYEGLERVYEKYKDKGFVVIGFPANNFGEQEPGTNEEILQFCRSKYSVKFPMMAKISVKGDDIHPLYDYLTHHSPLPGDLTWNFNKFLLDKNGRVVSRYDRKVTPEDSTIVGKIEELLK